MKMFLYFCLVLALCMTMAAGNNSQCSLPKDPGFCRAYFRSYYFNSREGKCEEFIYGGCQGNANRFATKAECEAACPAAQVGRCDLRKDPGFCRGRFPSYYFNSRVRKCEEFNYGGCQGNANRFATKAECEAACPVFHPIVFPR